MSLPKYDHLHLGVYENATPEDLMAKGVKFNESEDDMGRFLWAAVESQAGTFVLSRHFDSPMKGVDLYAPRTATASQVVDLMEELDLGDPLVVPS